MLDLIQESWCVCAGFFWLACNSFAPDLMIDSIHIARATKRI
jgi:hypothetical protein